MKTALVTGASGFVGRHMADELQRRGYVASRCDIVTGWDALDLFRDDVQRFDLVVHCAARAPHRAAIVGQPDVFLHNQLLDAAMFDWAVRTGQGRVLYFSSSAAYPVELQAAPITWPLAEDDIEFDAGLGYPDATYGWAKLTGERLANAARAAGLPVTVVRPFSGYGEEQGTDWPFGAFVERALRRDDPFTVWGDGSQVRDWIHIDDVVRGALAVIESGTTDPVNLCTGVGTSMVDLIGLLTAAAGYRPDLELRTDRPAGVARRVGDPIRLHRYYMPEISIEAGVKRALAMG